MMGTLGAWGWFGLGLVLIGIELLVAPGSFLLWIGLAALLLGAAHWLFPLGWTAELVLFALLSLFSLLVGVRVYRSRRRDSGTVLHDRLEEMRGKELALGEPIIAGYGQVRIGDTVWRVSGPTLPAGAKVRVIGLEGSTLRVEPVKDQTL